MKVLLSGNEAIARGAYEYGVKVATGYPGTPSSEILETIATEYCEIYAEWSPNEKVALEAAMGASFAGGRAIVCMKHVGVNVAADPLLTMAYTGVKGGFVLVTADDPGMHSSQDVRAILDLFDGEINIYEKETIEGPRKCLKIKKMTNQEYLENELPLKKERLQKRKRQGKRNC